MSAVSGGSTARHGHCAVKEVEGRMGDSYQLTCTYQHDSEPPLDSAGVDRLELRWRARRRAGVCAQRQTADESRRTHKVSHVSLSLHPVPLAEYICEVPRRACPVRLAEEQSNHSEKQDRPCEPGLSAGEVGPLGGRCFRSRLGWGGLTDRSVWLNGHVRLMGG
jgi:hypothetical protein